MSASNLKQYLEKIDPRLSRDEAGNVTHYGDSLSKQNEIRNLLRQEGGENLADKNKAHALQDKLESDADALRIAGDDLWSREMTLEAELLWNQEEFQACTVTLSISEDADERWQATMNRTLNRIIQDGRRLDASLVAREQVKAELSSDHTPELKSQQQVNAADDLPSVRRRSNEPATTQGDDLPSVTRRGAADQPDSQTATATASSSDELPSVRSRNAREDLSQAKSMAL